MQRFLRDLIALTLARRILPRHASVCRAIVQTSLEIGEHEVLENLEKRVVELEDGKGGSSRSEEEVIVGFLNQLPAGLRSPVIEYGRHQVKLEEGEKTE